MKRLSLNFTFVFASALSICSDVLAHEHHKPAAGGVKSLDVYSADGKEHLLIGEISPGKSEPELWYRLSRDDGKTWSNPVRVDADMPSAHGLARGNDAQIAASGDRLIAVWETAGDDEWGAGPMATAFSSDGGRTWKPEPNPADDGLKSGHGYIDISADKGGAFHLAWLDSRGGKQGLRSARSDDGGAHWSANLTIDSETCECCWNAVITDGGSNVYALYRDINPRDMAVAASQDSGKNWKRTSPPAVFGWQFNGCPDVGGGLAVADQKLHAVVWTGKQGATGLYYIASTDAGGGWSTPRRLDGNDARHSDLAANNGAIAVAWDTPAADKPGIFTAISRDAGLKWETARIPNTGQNPSHPRLLPVHDGFRVFWTDSDGEQTGWRSSLVRLQDSAAVMQSPHDLPLKVEHAWVRAVPSSLAESAAFLTIVNTGDQTLRLTGGNTPIAEMAMPMVGTKQTIGGQEVSGMKDVDALEVPAHGQLVLLPGGDHLMLMGLKQHPKAGDKVAITLHFEPGGRELKLEVPVQVDAAADERSH